MNIGIKRQEYFKDTPFPYGRYEGTLMQEVPAGFLLAIRDSDDIRDYTGLKDYIDENLPDLEAEVRRVLTEKRNEENNE